MRIRIAVLILALSILLSGCVDVEGNPIVLRDTSEVYADGFLDGCMSSILMLTSPQNLPPYNQAIIICGKIQDAVEGGELGDMPSERNTSAPMEEPAVVCEDNCI